MDQPEAFYDVVIIGGGPAGAAAGGYLARAGIRCVVFEREHFPRPHVGESLVPSSTRVLSELGFLPKMETHGFPHKFGAVWTVPNSHLTASHAWEGLEPSDNANIAFAEREQPDVYQPYTYHVDRGLFDHLFLEHTRELGAAVFYGAAVNGVDFLEPGKTRVRVSIDGESQDVFTKIVVDASGRRTFLGNRLNLKVKDPVFDQYAIHTWFEDFDRGSVDHAEYIFVHFLPITNTWIWQIPITDRITSIGLVTQKKNFTGSRKDRMEFFWDSLRSRPELYERVRAAKQLRDFTEEGDYSYAMSRITGDGYVLIGDAARFVDPIFSTGVSIAMNCARFVSRDIIAAIQADDFRAERFDRYKETLRRGVRNWYEFISLYYRLNILFTAFINHPDYRTDVLKLLQGDVYDEDEPPVLTKMRQLVTTVENNPNHLWHASLGELNAEALKSAF
ncbi:MAG TPA: NAD(P)/FAD-dependent oxidoreductase [Anaerolineales bacterium]|nr:NAD(P)/FAD-dependent oxidoreductase [Anaerolineales bacterium]